MKRCTRCLVPETYPGASFDHQGICNFCRDTSTTEPVGEQALLDKLSSRKGAGYDCVLGISGGKDSCYVAYLARRKYGLRALAVFYDFAFVRDLARQNVRSVCRTLDIDLVVVKSRNDLESDFMKNHLISLSGTGTTWGQCMFCHYGIDAILYSTAREKGIPFVLSGVTRNEVWWNPGSRTRLLMKHVKSLSLKEKAGFARFQVRAFGNLVDQRRQFPLPENGCLSVYKQPRLPKKGPETIRVFDYVPWDQRIIEKTLVEEAGWTKPGSSCSWRYDCILEPLLDYTYFKEFGISTVGLYLSSLIRSGLAGREEAVEILQEREVQQKLDADMLRVLDFLGIERGVKEKYVPGLGN